MPFALAWLNLRFADAPLELPFSLPFLGNTIEYFPSFLLLYIATRMFYSRVMRKIHLVYWNKGKTGRTIGVETFPHYPRKIKRSPPGYIRSSPVKNPQQEK